MEPKVNDEVVSARANRCYREEQVNGLSQKELILMLYDGAIRSSEEAKVYFEEENFVESYQRIVKARTIVTELLRILNMDEGGAVAENLKRLYVHMIGRLIEANFTKETALLDNVLTILRDLRSAWAELDFDEALTNANADNATSKGNGGGCSRPNGPRQTSDSSRLLSVTA